MPWIGPIGHFSIHRFKDGVTHENVQCLCGIMFLITTLVRGRLSTTFSQTLETTGKSESGRLFGACSWSLSFSKGITSAFFHALGYVDVLREQLMISVGYNMTDKQSLMTRILTLSGPGDLFEGIDRIMHCTSVYVCDRAQMEQFMRKIFWWYGYRSCIGYVDVVLHG